MKLLLMIMIMLSVSIHAESSNEKLNNWYVGMSYGVSGNDSGTYFDNTESISNTVGNGGMRTELKIGYIKERNNGLYTKISAYIWRHDQEKNNEQGIGLSLQGGGFVTNNLAVTIGGKAGVGNQKTEGKTFVTKSGSSNISYITNKTMMQPINATYTKDTDVVEIGLLLDFDYYVTKRVSLNLGFSYIMSSYSFSYQLEDGKFAQLSGVGQDNYYSSLGINICF